jgi:hypothetical protein
VSRSAVLETTIPEQTLFDAETHAALLGSHPVGSHAIPFALFGELTGRAEASSALLEAIAGEQLRVGDDDYLWLDALPDELWQELPLRSHEVVPHTPELRDAITDGLCLMQMIDPEAYRLVRTFVRVIAWVQLRGDYQARDSQITSSSFPVLPFCVFVSPKAQRHIPPNTILDVSSSWLLSENLFHEAVHQAINMNLLLFDVFAPHYDSRLAPKVNIPWRGTSVRRNQEWELDRVFHASVVYRHLLDYRAKLLAEADLNVEERGAFLEATDAGISAAKFLSASLVKFPQYFTDHGRATVEKLVGEVSEASERAELAAAEHPVTN